MSPRHPDAVYVLPLRADAPLGAEPLAYLSALVRQLEVVVVDGSAPDVRRANAAALPAGVRHVPAPVCRSGCNGKGVGVRRGLEVTDQPKVVVADDDVRWDAATLDRALAALDDADVVRPQNVFDPLPWHARWDTARSLLNRALVGDWPGTLVLRRAALPPSGYADDVLFENLELVRTVRARGGREVVARDLLVPRLPPSARHFWGQRVWQAYDSQAQPGRLAAELAVVPLVLAAARRHRAARTCGALAATAVAVAEVGRRRGGCARAYPRAAALWAPLWVGERAVCAWLALVQRAAGGCAVRGHAPACRGHTRPSAARHRGGGGMTPRDDDRSAPPAAGASPAADSPQARPRGPVRITPCPDGPLLVRGAVELVGPDGTTVTPRRRTVALCRCGGTATPPWCDGTHKVNGFRTADPA